MAGRMLYLWNDLRCPLSSNVRRGMVAKRRRRHCCGRRRVPTLPRRPPLPERGVFCVRALSKIPNQRPEGHVLRENLPSSSTAHRRPSLPASPYGIACECVNICHMAPPTLRPLSPATRPQLFFLFRRQQFFFFIKFNYCYRHPV